MKDEFYKKAVWQLIAQQVEKPVELSFRKEEDEEIRYAASGGGKRILLAAAEIMAQTIRVMMEKEDMDVQLGMVDVLAYGAKYILENNTIEEVHRAETDHNA